MNRWHARLVELHRAVIRFPDGVQNVQNVQNTLADVTFEQFEHSEHRSDDCKGRLDTGQERAVVEWPNHHSPRAGQIVEPSNAPFAKTLAALERRCPDYVEEERWQRAVEDGRRFLTQWGDQAVALGWTAKDLLDSTSHQRSRTRAIAGCPATMRPASFGCSTAAAWWP